MLSNLLSSFHLFGASCQTPFLGFVPWNYYLQTDNQCNIINFHVLGGNSSLILIALAILDDLFRAAGLLAVAFIMYAGFQFITTGGSPEAAAKARTTGINALIGLGIAMVAIMFVSFLGTALTDNHTGVSQSGGLDVSVLPNPANVAHGGFVQTAISIALGILGGVSFLVVVIAGMQYTFSQGDPQATSSAKNTIIYALIGLVIAIAAQSIVSLTLSRTP